MEITGIISAIVIGLIIGAVARLIVPGRQDLPIWLTIVVGVVAAFIGTAIAGFAGYATTPGIDWWELITQVVLAVIGVYLVAGLRSGRGRASA
ncbi:GlsB/YeaQ/YmgE family stress response membrane protein [Nocardiopsis mangrovi]|uniref:GlsB/YeaQ/YmgE family stress response membrane protein n=1 Tax=Nocardiopsis mangrovi TaxID=1179818 RepID=A0ABV9E046_9ACTN